MLAKAILVHGVIGYKFCWLLPFVDQNQGTNWAWNQMAPLSGTIERTWINWDTNWERIKCLFKRHLIKIQFFGIVKCVSWRDIFSLNLIILSVYRVFKNCERCLLNGFCGIMESVSSRDTFNINPFFWNCRSCILKRHL